MIYLLTTHGTLLVREGETIAHRPLREIADAGQLLGLDVPADALRQDWRGFLVDRPTPPVPFASPTIGEGRLEIDPTLGVVHLEQNGRRLSAGAPGGGTTWTDNAPDEWERLLPLTDDDLARLLQLFSGTWFIRSTRTLVRGWDVSLAERFVLRFGPVDIPLARNLPFETTRWPFRVTVLVEGWRIEEIGLFRPLVFYASFRSPAVHAQLFQSVQSLLEFGRYDGEVHVLTDLAHEDLCRGVPHFARDKLSVQPLEPRDFVGYVGAKYAILEHQPAWSHQPVLYLDPDIVINASLREMLVTIAASDVVTAPVENVGPMRSWPPVGGTLLQRDGQEPRFALGFNAGTIGIPNLPAHAAMLRLTRRIIGNLLKAEGRDTLPWVDQEVANYVSFRIGHVDTTAISRFVRYGGLHDADAPGVLNGMVHFWNTAKHDRHQVMARYVEALRAHARLGHHLS